ncbi:hypothetical protein B0H13DRAFT_2335470 [Mycena leptocephala]|nr:hypothetical protein B0H13DRAFT_2335470 [Mycena leptocephala]
MASTTLLRQGRDLSWESPSPYAASLVVTVRSMLLRTTTSTTPSASLRVPLTLASRVPSGNLALRPPIVAWEPTSAHTDGQVHARTRIYLGRAPSTPPDPCSPLFLWGHSAITISQFGAPSAFHPSRPFPARCANAASNTFAPRHSRAGSAANPYLAAHAVRMPVKQRAPLPASHADLRRRHLLAMLSSLYGDTRRTLAYIVHAPSNLMGMEVERRAQLERELGGEEWKARAPSTEVEMRAPLEEMEKGHSRPSRRSRRRAYGRWRRWKWRWRRGCARAYIIYPPALALALGVTMTSFPIAALFAIQPSPRLYRCSPRPVIDEWAMLGFKTLRGAILVLHADVEADVYIHTFLPFLTLTLTLAVPTVLIFVIGQSTTSAAWLPDTAPPRMQTCGSSRSWCTGTMHNLHAAFAPVRAVPLSPCPRPHSHPSSPPSSSSSARVRLRRLGFQTPRMQTCESSRRGVCGAHVCVSGASPVPPIPTLTPRSPSSPHPNCYSPSPSSSSASGAEYGLASVIVVVRKGCAELQNAACSAGGRGMRSAKCTRRPCTFLLPPPSPPPPLPPPSRSPSPAAIVAADGKGARMRTYGRTHTPASMGEGESRLHAHIYEGHRHRAGARMRYAYLALILRVALPFPIERGLWYARNTPRTPRSPSVFGILVLFLPGGDRTWRAGNWNAEVNDASLNAPRASHGALFCGTLSLFRIASYRIGVGGRADPTFYVNYNSVSPHVLVASRLRCPLITPVSHMILGSLSEPELS